VRDWGRVLHGTVRFTCSTSALMLFNHINDRSHRPYAMPQPHLHARQQSYTMQNQCMTITPHCFFCTMHSPYMHRSLTVIIIVLIIRYPLFLKTKPVLAADVHPVVFQLYKSTLVFLTSWLLLIPRAIRASHGELPEGEPV
jgi:hypothetical protein